MNRILFEAEQLGQAGEISLHRNDDRAKHIRKVLKLTPGDEFAAGIINGEAGRCVVTSVNEDSVTLRFEPSAEETPPPFPIRLLLAHPRPIVLRRMLKDLTTLGVGGIDVFLGRRGEDSYAESTIWNGESVRAFLIDGAMQAGATTLPEVSLHHRLEDALAQLPPPRKGDLWLFGDENAPASRSVFSWLTRCTPLMTSSRAFLAVGPDRGWDHSERRALEDSGFISLSLGPRILRTETAGLVVTAAVAGQYVNSEDPGESS